MKRRVLAIVWLSAAVLVSCALPTTSVPVCAWHYDVVCRAPSLAANTGQVYRYRAFTCEVEK